MRSLMALSLMLFGLSARGEAYVDGDALYQGLLRQDPSAIAYVLGVYDAIQVIQYHAQGPDAYFCAPPRVTAAELARAVEKSLEADPGIRNYPPGLLVFRALILTFPCGEREALLAPMLPWLKAGEQTANRM